jgi:HSP20 family protein
MKPQIVPALSKPGALKNLFKAMDDWTDRISKRAYELFQNRGGANGHDVEDWLAAESELLEPVAVEVTDAGNKVIVRAKIPGFEAKNLDIQVEDSKLVITGKKESKQEQKDEKGVVYSESKKEIYRVVDLPYPVIADKATASFSKGVMELKLPKSAQKPIPIKVTAA